MYALLPVLLGSEVVRCLVLGLPEGHRHSGPLWRRRSGLCGLTGRHRFLGLPVPHAPISIFKGTHTHALGTVGRQTRWWVSVDPLRQRQRAWAATSRAELVERQGWMLERERVGCETARGTDWVFGGCGLSESDRCGRPKSPRMPLDLGPNSGISDVRPGPAQFERPHWRPKSLQTICSGHIGKIWTSALKMPLVQEFISRHA